MTVVIKCPKKTNFDSFMILETTNCPDNYKITGLTWDVLNDVFYANGRTINGRPMYMSLNGVNGIWWDGEEGDLGDWLLGIASNVDDGQELSGWVSSNTQTNCPLFDIESSESWNGVWQTTFDVIFTVPGESLYLSIESKLVFATSFSFVSIF